MKIFPSLFNAFTTIAKQGAIALLATVALFATAPVAHANETIIYLHNDVSGSPQAATDASGNLLWKETYKPYGERTLNSTSSASGKGTNALYFHDKKVEALEGGVNLSYFGARYYDPSIGRFMGVDPQGFDPNSVHSFNRYAYGNNNPYKYVDPDGHSPIDVAFLIWDIGKLGVSVYSGVGVGHALADVGLSLVGVVSPIPGAGQALKAARAVDHAVEAGRGVHMVGNATKSAEKTLTAIPKPGIGKGAVPPSERDPTRRFKRDEVAKELEKQGGACANCGKEIGLTEARGHHVKRHADGGKTNAENLAVTCNPCHIEIHKRD